MTGGEDGTHGGEPQNTGLRHATLAHCAHAGTVRESPMHTHCAAVFSALLSLVSSALAASNPMDHQKASPKSDAAYKEAMQHVSELKVGISAHKVLALLGKPQSKAGNQWCYNFWDIAPPPQVGNQMVMGVAITFANNSVAKIDYATLCATGPGNSIPVQTPRKKAG